MIEVGAVTVTVMLAFSNHTVPGDWNETHVGVKAQHEIYIAGAYHNSEGDLSVFAGVELPVFDTDFNVELGAVTGYEGGAVLPMFRATYDFNDHVHAFLLPAVTTDTEEVGVAYGVGFEF